VLNTHRARRTYLKKLFSKAELAAYWREQATEAGNKAAGMPLKFDARRADMINHFFMSEICGVCGTRDGLRNGETWPINIRCDVCLRWTHARCTDASRDIQTLAPGCAMTVHDDDDDFVCAECNNTI